MYKISMNVLNKLWYFIFPTQHVNTLPPTLSFIPHSLSSNLCLFPHSSDIIIVILILWLVNYVCIEFFHTVTTGSQTTTPHNQNKYWFILLLLCLIFFVFISWCYFRLSTILLRKSTRWALNCFLVVVTSPNSVLGYLLNVLRLTVLYHPALMNLIYLQPLFTRV